MKRIGVTQRVEVVRSYQERRDCLDQRWWQFLYACDLTPVVLPNEPKLALELAESEMVSGLLFTGGNDLIPYGGDAPERDATEVGLIKWARQKNLPILGVCRGMQVIQHIYGVELHSVKGHVCARQEVSFNGRPEMVNSYHNYGTTESVDELVVCGRSDDNVVKAVRSKSEAILGIMWHPERSQPFSERDKMLFKEHFQVD